MGELIDLEAHRLDKDVESGELRQRVEIEFRGSAYQLRVEDMENDPPDLAFLGAELVRIGQGLIAKSEGTGA